MLPLLTLLSALCATPAATGDTVRIDCGSTQSYRTADGRLFMADQFFTNGQVFTNPTVNVAGTTDDVLYRTERAGPAWLAPLRYNIPVPAGDYLVRLHLAEIYFGAPGGPPATNGQRVFSMQFEGRRVLINYDLHAAVGPMVAVVKEYRATVVDGLATLDFLPVVGDPAVTAIEVLRLPAGSVPPPCSWTQRAAVSLERKEGQCALVGPYLYTFGGYYTALQATNLTQRYDLATDQWATLAPMPLPATHTAEAVVGTTVWIIGGFVGNWPGVVTDAVQVYDTPTNSWRMAPPLPLRRGAGAAALVGRKLHFFGGLEPDIQTDSPLHYVLDLDQEAAGWRLAAPLPLPRCHLGGASRGGKIYALGGQYGHNRSVDNTALVHEYDPLSDTWTRRADFPTVRSHFESTVTVLDGRILTVGGFDGRTNYEDVLSYEPDTESWSQLCEMPLPLGGAMAKVLGNTLIVAQGEGNNQPGPAVATRTTLLRSTASNVLSFSRTQLAAQAAPGGTLIVPNLLWTLSGTANYVLSANVLPAWITLMPGNGSGSADPLGRAVNFQVNATGLAPGVYTSTVQATAPGYTPATTTIALTVAVPTAAAAGRGATAISIFPNPTSDHATLRFSSLSTQTVSVEVRNILGQLVWQNTYSAAVGDNRLELVTNTWAPGVYQILIQRREGPLTARLLLTH